MSTADYQKIIEDLIGYEHVERSNTWLQQCSVGAFIYSDHLWRLCMAELHDLVDEELTDRDAVYRLMYLELDLLLDKMEHEAHLKMQRVGIMMDATMMEEYEIREVLKIVEADEWDWLCGLFMFEIEQRQDFYAFEYEEREAIMQDEEEFWPQVVEYERESFMIARAIENERSIVEWNRCLADLAEKRANFEYRHVEDEKECANRRRRELFDRRRQSAKASVSAYSTQAESQLLSTSPTLDSARLSRRSEVQQKLSHAEHVLARFKDRRDMLSGDTHRKEKERQRLEQEQIQRETESSVVFQTRGMKTPRDWALGGSEYPHNRYPTSGLRSVVSPVFGAQAPTGSSPASTPRPLSPYVHGHARDSPRASSRSTIQPQPATKNPSSIGFEMAAQRLLDQTKYSPSSPRCSPAWGSAYGSPAAVAYSYSPTALPRQSPLHMSTPTTTTPRPHASLLGQSR